MLNHLNKSAPVFLVVIIIILADCFVNNINQNCFTALNSRFAVYPARDDKFFVHSLE